MAIVRPFCGVRPNKEYASKVISLPYDVMNRREAKEMAEGNPYSFLHISRSEIDLEDGTDIYDELVYKKAKENLNSFIEQDIFKIEKKPVLYIYRQEMDGRIQTGITCCVSVSDYENDIIKKHEFTRVDKEIDRINHFDFCNANTEPVFLTYREDDQIKEIVSNWVSSHLPEYDFFCKDGIGHALWVLDDDLTIEKIVGIFDKIPYLYIADGHHRSASAYKVGLKRRNEHPDFSGKEEFNFFMAVVFPKDDLYVFDYNRVVQDLNGNSNSEFLHKVEKAGFEVSMCHERYFPEEKHCFGMYLENQWYKITALPEIIPNDMIEQLDVSILQKNLLAPILGIGDPRTDKRIDFVGGIRGLEELERRVKTDMKVAFSVHPVEIEDLLNVSDNGLVMPPKSTWFEPKLGSGLFIHQLD